MPTHRLMLAALGAVMLAGAPALADTPPTVAAAEAPPADQAAVDAAVRAWFAAFVARDGATLDRLTTHGFKQSMWGTRTPRSVALGMPLNSPDYRIEAIDVETLAIRIDGDRARVTGVIRRRDNFSGQIFNTRADVEQTWRREASGWRIATDKETEKK